MKWLNSNGCHFKGSVPKSEVKQIQKEADIVVFVESLDKKHRMDARLSFSTKLTDYFSSGKCIFAIGDKSIAPIQYLQENNAAIIATEYSQIEEKLIDVLSCRKKIIQYGRNAFECGKRNHEEQKVKKTFIETITRAAEKRKSEEKISK